MCVCVEAKSAPGAASGASKPCRNDDTLPSPPNRGRNPNSNKKSEKKPTNALSKQAMDGAMNLEAALEERLRLINCTPNDIKRFLKVTRRG